MSYLVGVTGPTGSGKTVLCKYFENKGCPIIYSDVIAKEILLLPSCIKQLVNTFGVCILAKNKEIDRAKLAGVAFKCKEQTDKLNSITHPYILKSIHELIQKYSSNDIILLDAPLLIEAGLKGICNCVVSVIANEEIRLNRIIERDNITEEQAKLRIAAQKNDEFYISNSNIYIYNNGNENEFYKNIIDIEQKIRGDTN